MFTDQAATALQVARFPKGHTAVCDCVDSDGKIDPKDCAGLTVSDPGKKKVARFEGQQFQAKQSDDGGVVIFRLPVGATKDSLTPQQAHAARLHRLNEEHAKFYRKGPIA